MKINNIIIGIIFPVLILAISFSAYYFIESRPLVIFAGGGSVSNYLKSILKEPNDFSSSVYINIPSGYVEKLLLEEIQRFGKKSEEKHPFLNISLLNKEIVDWNTKGLEKPFRYIGLSAVKIEYDSLFNSEYTHVYEYHIGEDSLAVYYIEDKNNKQYQDTKLVMDLKNVSIDFDTLVQDLISPKTNNMKIYSTSPFSGTRKAYENLLKGNKDSTTLMGKLDRFFDTNIIPTNSVVLSSIHYPPSYNDSNGIIKRTIIRDKNREVCSKKLYVYFIGYKSRDSIYKPNSQIIDFLNLCAKEIHKKEENYFSMDSIWEIKSSERNKMKLFNFENTKNN